MDQNPEKKNNFKKKYRHHRNGRKPNPQKANEASEKLKAESQQAPTAQKPKPQSAQQPAPNPQQKQKKPQKPLRDETAVSEEIKNKPHREQKGNRPSKQQSVKQKKPSFASEEPQKIEDTPKTDEKFVPLSNIVPGPEVLEDIPKYTKITSSKIDDEAPKVKVVGIQFKAAGKVYYFDPGNIKLSAGSYAVVETARGLEFGEVIFENRLVSESSIVTPLRPVIRQATPEDIAHNKENEAKEESVFKIGQEKISAHGLDMKLVDAQYTFDNSKLLFYFTSAGRVDFRELVKDLAGVFHTRIELRQIGIRDEAKMMGGLGACGRPLCCASFLSDFVQVSIKMAKEQSLSLNSNKISGACGRLMCCLRYECESYEAELRLMPPMGSKVKTPDGLGTVVELSPISGTVKVNIDDKQDSPQFKTYKKDEVIVLSIPTASRKVADDSEDDSDVLPNE